MAPVAVQHRAVPAPRQATAWSSHVFERPAFKIRDAFKLVIIPQIIGTTIGVLLLIRALTGVDLTDFDPADVPIGPFLWMVGVTAALQLLYLAFMVFDRELDPARTLGWRVGPVDALLGVGSVLLIWAFLWLLSWLAPSTQREGANPIETQVSAVYSNLKEHHWLILIALLAAAVPLVEELVFRGVLYLALEEWFGRIAAVAGSAVVFGLAHATTYSNEDLPIILFASFAGLVFGTTRAVTGRIAAGVIGHALNNLAVCLALSSSIR